MVGMPRNLAVRCTCWTPDFKAFDCESRVPVSAVPDPSTVPVQRPRRQAAPSMLKSATLVEAETETWSRCGPLIGATELLLMISMGPVGGTPLPLAQICASPWAFAATELTATTAPLACESTAAKL